MVFYRFYRRIPIIPGLVRLNIAKGSVSISVGKRGWSITFGKHGVRFTKGVPGTGMFFSHNVRYKGKSEEKEDGNIDLDKFIR